MDKPEVYVKLTDVRDLLDEASEEPRRIIKEYGYHFQGKPTADDLLAAAKAEKLLSDLTEDLENLDTYDLSNVELPMPPEGTNGQTVGE